MTKKKGIGQGLLSGVLAGILASALMDGYWLVAAKFAGERPEQKPKKGSQQKDEPSTQIVADKVSKAFIGEEVPKDQKPQAGVAVHYATGAVWGGLFGALAAVRPRTGLLAGLLYGTFIWAFLDEMMLRALNLAPDPRQVPKEEHLEALGAHLVYGASTALLARLFLN